MWIISKDYGLINADRCKRIFADYNGQIRTDDNRVISDKLSALSRIMEAIKHNDDYVEVD